MSFLSNLFLAIAKVFGFVTEEKELYNTEEMQKRDKALRDAKLNAELDKILKDENVKETQKKISHI